MFEFYIMHKKEHISAMQSYAPYMLVMTKQYDRALIFLTVDSWKGSDTSIVLDSLDR